MNVESNSIYRFLGNVRQDEHLCIVFPKKATDEDKSQGINLGKYILVKRKPDQLKTVHSSNLTKVLHEVDKYLTFNPTQPKNPSEATTAWEKIKEKIQQTEQQRPDKGLQKYASYSLDGFWMAGGTHSLTTTRTNLEKKLMSAAIGAVVANAAQAAEPSAEVEIPKASEIAPDHIDTPQLIKKLQNPTTANPLDLKAAIIHLTSEIRTKGTLKDNQKPLLEQCFACVWMRSQQFNRLISDVGFGEMHSLLLLLVLDGRVDQMKFLLEQMIPVMSRNIRIASEFPIKDVPDYVGIVLGAAIYHGNEAMVDAILEKKPNVNVRLVEGKTPLHLAAIGGNPSIIEKLGRAGADATLTDEQGRTAPQYYEQALRNSAAERSQ